MACIQQLPVEVRSYLRSGVTVTSVTQCVEELLLNSLDAGATCVAVRVDPDCFKIQVVDNGSGIPQDQLKLVAERYATSKCHSVTDLDNLSYFGYRGEALASLRESCTVLEITSKTKDTGKTFSKLFQDGRSLDIIESTVPRPSAGTTITIHDLFSKFPVRRKSTNASLELERIRQRVEALALLRPSVSVSLRNDTAGVVLVQTHKCSNSLLTFKHLFGAAKANALSEVTGSRTYFTVEGFVGKEGYSKKELQFIYVNGRLLLKTKIHKLVNKMLTNSAIFKRKYGSEESTPVIENKSVFVKSPGRQIERYPIFVLDIKCPLTKYDITFDPSKTLIDFKDWDTLMELTKEIINSFLKRENLDCASDTVCVDSNAKPPTKKEEESNTGKRERKSLSTILSPSALKDTVFSKPAKRKLTEKELYKTPLSVSIEEWKAENKVRKIDLNETEAQSSINNSDVVIDEKTGSHPCLSILQLRRLQKGDSHNKLKNCIEIAHDQKPVESRERIVPFEAQSGARDANTSPVSVISKPSLSEFRKAIGKPVTNEGNIVSVDEKLKANFRLHPHKKAEDRLDRRDSQCLNNPIGKYTSSLQKFKRSVHSITAENGNNASHKMENRSTSDAVQNSVSLRKRTELFGKSRVYLTDSKETIQSSAENTKSHNYSASDTNGLNNPYSNPNMVQYVSGARNTADCVAFKAPVQCMIYNRTLEVGSDFNVINRKRPYNDSQSEKIAYKLSKLSKQKTVSVSVTSTCGPERGPLDTEISCGDNAVVTLISEREELNTNKTFAPLCATVTSTTADHQFSEPHNEKSDNTKRISDTAKRCLGNFSTSVNEKDHSSSIKVDKNIHDTHLNHNINASVNKANQMSENSKEKEVSKFDGSVSDNIKDTNTAYNCLSCDKQTTAMDIVNIEERTADSEDQFIEISNSEIRTNQNIKDGQEQLKSEVLTDTDSEPFAFSTQGFSPCMSEHQTGLSQQLTNISLSETSPFHAEKLTPCLYASPCSEGFSPCLSASPQSLPDIGSKDSQGFIPCDENKQVAVEKMQKYNNCFSSTISLVKSDEQTKACLTTDKKKANMSNCLNTVGQSDDDNTGVELFESHESLRLLSSKQSENNSVGGIEGQECPTADTNTESENVSGNADILTDQSVRISQMLLTASQHQYSESCSVDALQHNSGIHFSDIFTSSLSDKEHTQTQEDDMHTQTKVSDISKDRSQFKGSGLGVLQPGNTDSIVKDNSSLHVEPVSEEAGKDFITDDTLLQPTPDDSELFSSWEGYSGNAYKITKGNHGSVLCDDNNISDTAQNTHTSEKVESMRNDQISIETKVDKMTQINSMAAPSTKSKEDEIKSSEDSFKEVKNHEKDELQVNVGAERDTKSKEDEIKSSEDSFKEVKNHEKDELQVNVGAERDTEQRKWIQLQDPQTGKKMYVHSLLGTTVFESQWKVPQADEGRSGLQIDNNTASEENAEIAALTPNTTESLHTLMTDFLTTGSKTTKQDDGGDGNEDEEMFVKWRDSHTHDKASIKGPSTVEELFAEWSNPVFESTDKDVINTEVSALPKTTVKAYRSLHSCKFTKEMLSNVKVIGQVDKKFIACLMKTDPSKSTRPDMLTVIDQHAAHERIRLELLTEEAYKDSDVESGTLEVYKVEPQKSMELTEDEVRILTSYKEEFSRIGVNFHCDPQSTNKIIIETIPACIMEKDVNYVKSTRETVAWNIVQALIKEHVDLLVSTGGAGKRFPTVLHKALCSQACHGAIKFGDSLSLRESEALIKDLSRCDLPFQCAHGRPSVMPVLQLEHLTTKLPQEKQKRPQLYKLSNAIQKGQSPKQLTHSKSSGD